jgi:hypothetical protein
MNMAAVSRGFVLQRGDSGPEESLQDEAGGKARQKKCQSRRRRKWRNAAKKQRCTAGYVVISGRLQIGTKENAKNSKIAKPMPLNATVKNEPAHFELKTRSGNRVLS